MKNPFRLLIAIPCMDYLHAEFVKSLVRLTTHLSREGIAYDVDIHAGSLIYMARNRMACKAVNENFTHLLFIDSDMVFDESIVEALRFSGKEIICGAFQSRRPPYGSCVFSSLKPLTKVKSYGLKPFKAAGCGMAMTMISTDVIRDVQASHGNPFDPATLEGISFGEDLAFCWRANKTGHEIWCEPTARVGHIAHVPIWPGEEPAT